MSEIIKIVENDDEINEVARCARITWHDTYDPLLPDGQVDYMLEKYQSPQVIKNDIENNGYVYYILFKDNETAGFCGVKKEPDRLFVSKIYVMPKHQRHGMATRLFERVKSDFGGIYDFCYLTVNKHNEKAISTYKALGFTTAATAVTDIGHGYVMDDYIMEYKF